MANIKYVGIIGWNAQAETLARTYHFDIKGTEVLAMSTQSADGQDFARDVLGLKHVFSEPHLMYELHQLDMICILSDPDQHKDQVAHSFKSGVSVLLEHPMASNVSDCMTIESTVKSYPSQKFMLALPRRFNTDLKGIKDFIESGQLGEVINISIRNYESIASGASTRMGIFMDVTLQDIDMVRWLTGAEFKSVFANGSAKKIADLKSQNDVDTANALCKMTDGTMVQFYSTRAIDNKDGYHLHITGTERELTYHSQKTSINISSNGNSKSLKTAINDDNYLKMLQFFAKSVTTSERLPYGAAEGTAATKVAVAMTKSYLLGQIEILE